MGNILGRAIVGMLLSSLLFGAAYALSEFGLALLRAPESAAPAFLIGPLVTATLLATFFAVTVLTLIGRPIYLILLDHTQWYTAMIVGLIVGFAVDFALAFTLIAAGADGGGLLAHLPGMLITSARVGALGAVGGYIFWLIARPGRAA